MLIWIRISAVVILLFTLPGLFLSLLQGRYTAVELLLYLLLSALAVHDLYYARKVTQQARQAYRHLAVGQFLLGLIVGLLLLRLGLVFSDPQTWSDLSEMIIQTANASPAWQMMGVEPPTRAMWDAQLQPLRSVATLLPLCAAGLSVLSQGLFAWFLYRRSLQPPATADIGQTGEQA